MMTKSFFRSSGRTGPVSVLLALALVGLLVMTLLRFGPQKWKPRDGVSSSNPADLAEAEKAYELGFKYYRGGGDVLIDHERALEHFNRASELGLPEAQARLAELLNEKSALDFLRAPDPKKASEWAKKALAGGLQAKAEEKKRRAEYELASLYLYGLALPRNYDKAAQLFKDAASQGDSDAKRALGFLYLAGLGVSKNPSTAEKYFQEAAADRIATAQLWLGILYLGGEKDIPKSAFKAVEMFQKASDQGLTSAQEQLGKCYEKGEGVPQNYTKAAELYQQAAARGDWSAQLKLGGLYERG